MATGRKIDKALQGGPLSADPKYYSVFTLVLTAVNTVLLVVHVLL